MVYYNINFKARLVGPPKTKLSPSMMWHVINKHAMYQDRVVSLTSSAARAPEEKAERRINAAVEKS